jgi:hypothetical protein
MTIEAFWFLNQKVKLKDMPITSIQVSLSIVKEMPENVVGSDVLNENMLKI